MRACTGLFQNGIRICREISAEKYEFGGREGSHRKLHTPLKRQCGGGQEEG